LIDEGKRGETKKGRGKTQKEAESPRGRRKQPVGKKGKEGTNEIRERRVILRYQPKLAPYIRKSKKLGGVEKDLMKEEKGGRLSTKGKD